MLVALGLVGVDRLGLDGPVRLGGREVRADLQRSLELGELAAHGGDAHVLDGEADLGVPRVDGPGAGRDQGGCGSAHGVSFLVGGGVTCSIACGLNNITRSLSMQLPRSAMGVAERKSHSPDSCGRKHIWYSCVYNYLA